MIETNETEIRSELKGVFINKSSQIINTGRLRAEFQTPEERGEFQKELIDMLKDNATAQKH